jgi:carbon monoxide dehydrogenase subunit G
MIIEESFTIDSPLQSVWDFFLNVEQIARCMPGAEVKQTDPNTYEGELRVKVGPIGASFGGTVTITNQAPPNSVTANAKAKDKMTGSMVQSEFTSNFKSIGPSQTEVSYKIDVVIRGKMGTFGQTVIQDTAKRLSAEFLACVKGQIETPQGKTAPPPISTGKATGVALTAFVGAFFSALRGWFKARFGRKNPTEQQ